MFGTSRAGPHARNLFEAISAAMQQHEGVANFEVRTAGVR